MTLQEQLTQKLSGTVRTVGREVLWLEETDSTNLVCRRMAAEGAAEGLAVLARTQTAGRGRRGRSFQSTGDLGLYLSVLLRPEQGMEEVSNMTAWVAVAVCDGVERACGVRPEIKWINDIILNGKKLGGILTEAGLEQGKMDHLVVGIGVNVNHTPEDFQPELRSMATSLSIELPKAPDMAELAAYIIRALDEMYAAFPAGKADYLEKYRAGCITTGKPVQIITPASREEGESLSIDEDFRLVVRMENGEERALSAGEVSVRGMYGYL
jgi:BirA family biotin operon repressor/biotin-[acetyl-CoA-carboxylase] ligase